MTTLLILIYVAFISLGLPDSLLGSAWPMIHTDLSIPVSFAGLISMTITCGTILSSLNSDRLIRRFGTGPVTCISVFMTAAALLGFYFSPHLLWFLILAVPLGLGAGAIDSALNNFVALHYKASHMNWLHCFWGVGATAGPMIMALFLTKAQGWRNGYLTISIIQFALVALLLLSLPLWKRCETPAESDSKTRHIVKTSEVLRMRGAKPALISFFCYCAVEATTGLWGSTYLVQVHGLSAKTAASWIALYYLGITIGRLLAGFLSMRLSNKQLIRLGQGICIMGCLTLFLGGFLSLQLVGLLLIGLGCAPIFPAMLHETPRRFGKEVSQSIMGIQMAFAYIGSTCMPPLFGFLAKVIHFQALPYYLIAIVLLMVVTSERVNRMY
ncbi:MAG: MFS transporter [Lachnospiraceae bacterium]